MQLYVVYETDLLLNIIKSLYRKTFVFCYYIEMIGNSPGGLNLFINNDIKYVIEKNITKM